VHWAATVISIGALAGLTTVVMVLVLGQTRVLFAMSRDGLLPRPLAKTGPHGTPVRITVLVAVLVAVSASVFPIDKLEEMVNVGTLFAFILVSAGVIVLRRSRPDLERGFTVPGVPWLPVASIIACLWLMLNLTALTWIRFLIWMVLGWASTGSTAAGIRASRPISQPRRGVVPDGTGHQPRRRHHPQAVEQAEPAQEPLAQHGFGLGRPEELVEQIAHRAIPRRLLPGSPVQDEIADRIHVPHREGVLRDRPAEIRRQVAVASGQQPLEFARLQRRHRHALPVGRVEADHRIAHGQDAVGEAVELVVPPPPAGRVLVDRDLAHRLAAADRRRYGRAGSCRPGRTSRRSPSARRPSRRRTW
jgi:hypothetical protein